MALAMGHPTFHYSQTGRQTQINNALHLRQRSTRTFIRYWRREGGLFQNNCVFAIFLAKRNVIKMVSCTLYLSFKKKRLLLEKIIPKEL